MDDNVSEQVCWALRYLAENLEVEKLSPVVAPVFMSTAGLLYNLAMEEKNKVRNTVEQKMQNVKIHACTVLYTYTV